MLRHRTLWLALLIAGLSAIVVAFAAPHGQLSADEETLGATLVVVSAILLIAPRRPRRRTIRR